MKKTLGTLAIGLAVAGYAATGGAACGHCGDDEAHEHKEPKVKAQTTCPVMGGKVNKDLYVDHDGKRVYVCCKGCIAAVEKEPQKYIDKLEANSVTVARVQTTCPVMGGKVNKNLYVDHDGKRIYVCCQGCIGALQKDPGKYIKKLEDAGVVLDRAAEAEKEEEGHGAHGGQEAHH
jgi:YHS domain-containing protein